MKKNLRIVSAAAAALLAVAPVAASAVSVNAADSTATTTAKATDYTNINLGGATVSNNERPSTRGVAGWTICCKRSSDQSNARDPRPDSAGC